MLPPKLPDVNRFSPPWLDNLLSGMLDFAGVVGLCWTTAHLNLVETAGIEPASESTLPLDLHVYPTVYLTTTPPNGRGCFVAVPYFLALGVRAHLVAIL